MRPLIALALIVMVFPQNHNDQNTSYKFDKNGRVIIPNKDILSKLPKDGGEHFNRLVFENDMTKNPLRAVFEFCELTPTHVASLAMKWVAVARYEPILGHNLSYSLCGHC